MESNQKDHLQNKSFSVFLNCILPPYQEGGKHTHTARGGETRKNQGGKTGFNSASYP